MTQSSRWWQGDRWECTYCFLKKPKSLWVKTFDKFLTRAERLFIVGIETQYLLLDYILAYRSIFAMGFEQGQIIKACQLQLMLPCFQYLTNVK